MNNRRDSRRKRIAHALGANRAFAVETDSAQGPISWLALEREVRTRLSSTGGRPTDRSWQVRRLVPFSQETWSHLGEMAEDISAAQGKAVSAAQVAAILVERGIESMKRRPSRRSKPARTTD